MVITNGIKIRKINQERLDKAFFLLYNIIVIKVIKEKNMASVSRIQERLKYINPNYEVTAMFFKTTQIKAIVILPDHNLVVLTDIAQGVATQLGPWQGVKFDDSGAELDARNYVVISLEEESKNEVESRE